MDVCNLLLDLLPRENVPVVPASALPEWLGCFLTHTGNPSLGNRTLDRAENPRYRRLRKRRNDQQVDMLGHDDPGQNSDAKSLSRQEQLACEIIGDLSLRQVRASFVTRECQEPRIARPLESPTSLERRRGITPNLCHCSSLPSRQGRSTLATHGLPLRGQTVPPGNSAILKHPATTQTLCAGAHLLQTHFPPLCARKLKFSRFRGRAGAPPRCASGYPELPGASKFSRTIFSVRR